MIIPASECQLARDLLAAHGTITAAAKAGGRPYSWMYRRLQKGADTTTQPELALEPEIRGRVHATPRIEWEVPHEAVIKRYIFTSAQSNTRLHDGVWENLKALAAFYDARICVSTFTYNKASYGAASVKRGSSVSHDTSAPWYDPRIKDYLLDESIVVAPGLVWCGEMNILPTAVRPLSGFEAYTGRKSGIFPHVKFAMESVASAKSEGTKFNYTTGTITQRNYIQKKEGLKAEFHHGYGALLVEVNSRGNWFVRQLNADSDGVIYDLDKRVSNGTVTTGHRLEALTWGDVHTGTIPLDVLQMIWGRDGMLDTLKPRYQFMHDILDFRSKNHHDRGDPHKVFRKYVSGEDDVVDELKEVAQLISDISYRYWCETVVVDSNHDNAMARWLREADYRTDPKNAMFFLEAQARVYKSIMYHEDKFHLLEWATEKFGVNPNVVKFLRPDESFIICPDAGGGIECGMHGDHGANGARASLRGFAIMGRKSNTGHGHSTGIYDGAYRSGITGDLDQGYNIGPSSWSRSHIGTYENGKRVILTSYAGEWRA